MLKDVDLLLSKYVYRYVLKPGYANLFNGAEIVVPQSLETEWMIPIEATSARLEPFQILLNNEVSNKNKKLFDWFLFLAKLHARIVGDDTKFYKGYRVNQYNHLIRLNANKSGYFSIPEAKYPRFIIPACLTNAVLLCRK